MPQPRRHQVGFGAHFIEEVGINRLRISGGEDLLDAGAVILDETGRHQLAGGQMLLAVQLNRATHAFESVIVLCRIGRGVPAAALARTLLEDALDAHWVAANPDQAPALADRHDRLIRLADRAMEERFERPTEALSESESEELDELVAEYDNFHRSWTKATKSTRIRLIKERWGEAAATQIDYVFAAIQRRNNVLVHGSPSAYRPAMSHDLSRGSQINRVGPDLWWRESLSHGGLGYYFTSRVVAEEFGVDKTVAAETFERLSCYLKPLGPEELADADPGAPCPCGSGRALGECHAS